MFTHHGPVGNPSFMLKYWADALPATSSLFFHRSLAYLRSPASCELATTESTFKECDRAQSVKYRPIELLPIFSYTI